MLKTFSGGVHPPEYKELAREKTIIRADLPSRLVIILSQHTGAPAKPIVELREKVKRGQKIAEAQGFVSANIHSPVEGTVIAIKPHLTSLGVRALSILIDVEGEGEEQRFQVSENPSPDDIRNAVREAGIVGLGGAAFPTHVKICPPEEFPIDVVILNGCECEPFLSVDFRLMVEKPAEILQGMEFLRSAVGAKRAFVAIEDNKLEAVEAIRKEASKFNDLEIVTLPTRYPQGSEKQLIKAVVDREIPSGCLPFHVGVLVQNVQTAFAVRNAVKEGIPLYERVVTVTGQSILNPSNFIVPVGMLAKDLIDQAGGLKDDIGKVIFGGPMTGHALGTLEVPVIKGTSGIVALPKDMVSVYPEEDICIRCGWCVEACPARIMPNLIGTYARLNFIEKAVELNLMDCIECGICAYICPARRNLLQYIRYGKAKSRELNRKT